MADTEDGLPKFSGDRCQEIGGSTPFIVVDDGGVLWRIDPDSGTCRKVVAETSNDRPEPPK